MANKTGPNRAADTLGTGRRKTAVARVRLRGGAGAITVNGRPYDEFFVGEHERKAVLSPLQVTEKQQAVDIEVSVMGGGPSGQAGAVMLGIARALKLFDSTLEPALRGASLLTRDSRMKERKKYGHKGARKSFQFSKL